MRIFIVAVCLLLVVMAPVVATEMCANDDTIVIVLSEKNVALGSQSGNSVSWTAKASGGFRYYGYATMLSEAEGGKPSGGQGSITNSNGEILPTGGDSLIGLSGTDADGNDRIYCWCRMAHPVSSYWTFYGKETGTTPCGYYCAHHTQVGNMLKFQLATVGK